MSEDFMMSESRNEDDASRRAQAVARVTSRETAPMDRERGGDGGGGGVGDGGGGAGGGSGGGGGGGRGGGGGGGGEGCGGGGGEATGSPSRVTKTDLVAAAKV